MAFSHRASRGAERAGTGGQQARSARRLRGRLAAAGVHGNGGLRAAFLTRLLITGIKIKKIR
jgi:hypothetical protein